ncbi:helix-turn-helix domain-containing protein [Saccharibacillus sp. CPCC 101409]|uniref:helix-turn-helix domain-containing protein n=1 Tax=Saccharibacillus sp. CPCC 101409 TaxID=3058041 RepID=UPI002672E787|nr:helix-turn-helix domain-containing protein [Saccharibacillus sp. CPCC 101409]MDO3411151.1 helix-turn-helix domain-containing protein [Saccharibacillus sp. CPCC 101409]
MEQPIGAYILTDIRYEADGRVVGADVSGEQAASTAEKPQEAETGEALREKAGREARGEKKADAAGAELWIVTGGSGTLRFGGAAYRLARGRLILGAFAGAEPERDAREAEPLTLYRLAFRMLDADGGPAPAERGLPFAGALDCAPFSFFAERAQELHTRREEHGAAAALRRQILFQELLLAAVRQQAERPRAGSAESVREAVRRSVERIGRDYREPLTVEALAESADVGRWAYTNLFKEMTGRLPLDYVNDVRIGQAKRLLLATDDRLHEIAQRTGFSSEYYLGRRFKKAAGLSPGQYRRFHRREIRVFAPYLEDALLAIGIVPVAQYSHRAWGVQEYLPLGGVPAFDIAEGTREDLSRLKPEVLLFDDGFERWNLDRLDGLAPSLRIEPPGESWQARLRRAAEWFGRESAAEEALRRCAEAAREARSALAAAAGRRGERGLSAGSSASPAAGLGTVACLRVSARHIMLYAERTGYTGPVLYGQLGLEPPAMLRRLPEGRRQVLLAPEELPRLDADHLFVVFDKSENERPGDERRLLEHPVWRGLPAVRAGRVYEADFFAWMNYGLLAHERKVRDVMNALGQA